MATGSSAAGSKTKVPSTGKASVSLGANPSDSAEVTTSIVTPVGGLEAEAAAAAALNVTADYYRNGVADPTDPTLRAPPRQLYPLGIQNDYEGDKVTASVRIRGRDPKNGNQEIDYIPAYTKFILEGVQESYSERHQVVETFGDFWVFFYGARPSVFNLNGMLINTHNVKWLSDFMFFYENFLRGTKCAELNARAIVTYGGRQIEGYILNTSNQTNAVQEEGVPFSFQFLVTQRNSLGFSEDFGRFVGRGGSLQTVATLQAIVSQLASNKGTGESDPGTGAAKNAAKASMQGGPAAFPGDF